MIKFKWRSFFELTLEELYELLKIRAEVFVVEQMCSYLDPDGFDQKAQHLLGYENNKIIAYLRLFTPSSSKMNLIFGRFLTANEVRAKGYGKLLMNELIKFCDEFYPNIDIECSAQLYLKSFYEDFGFVTVGDMYNEDNIPHIAMKKFRH